MNASQFWIGAECMPVSVIQDAAPHSRPILCGDLADVAAVRFARDNYPEQAKI